jgi:glycosyltransferase involved in cell wall biosynthesis
MLVNWRMKYLNHDDDSIQPPDKVVSDEPYWFFKYWPSGHINVDVIDIKSLRLIQKFEKDVLKFYIIQAFRSFPRTCGYDVILSHGAQSAVSLAFLRTAFGKRIPPHIVIDVGCFNGGRNNFLELFPIKAVSHTINGVIYHSSIQRSYYSRHFAHLATRFIPFGIDTDFFERSTHVTETDDYLIAFGKRKRDYRTLCEAWRLLNPGNLKLHIVGVKTLRNFGVDVVPKGITIHAWMSISGLKNMIEHAKFIILPLPIYNYAYGQMSLLQSMSMGKAVIVTRTPATVDYVRDNVDAVFVRPYDCENLLDKMRYFIQNPDVIQKIGMNAYSIVRKRFTEKHMAVGIHEFINMVLK